MNKQDIYNYLKENNIWHEITEHKAVYNMAELAEVDTLTLRLMQRIFLSVMIKRKTFILSLFAEISASI